MEQPTETSEPQTFRQKLDAGEQHWLWKLSLRIALVVVGIIGIGCMSWAVATSTSDWDAYYGFDDRWSICWSLITFGCSIIWSLICILLLLLRRPPRPAHPGVAVGLDLVLWLAYIPTIMFAVLAVVDIVSYGSGGVINQYSSGGYYWHSPNGTWVYNATEYDTYYNYTRSCDDPDRYEYRQFRNCAQEDAYVNKLWGEKNHRAGVEITGTVCQGICLVVHFILFVWACVDTNRRNRKVTTKEAELLAANIVMRMVQNGAIVTNPHGQQVTQQPLLHPQQMQQPGMAGPIGVASPMMPQGVYAPEKGQPGTRYA